MLLKAIVAFVLLVAAAVGGAMLYVRSEVKSMLDDLVAAVAPLGEMRYASVFITPTGTVRVRGVQLRPHAVNEVVRMEGIEVETPGLWFLLTGAKKVREGRLPEHLRATLRGIVFELEGPMATTIDRFVAVAAQSSGAPPVSNCGDLQYVDFGAYRRLGYSSLVFDITAGYRFEKNGPLRVTITMRTRDLGVTTVALEFAGLSPNLRENLAVHAPLRAFDVVYRDLSFTERFKSYCSRASGMTVQQYIDSEVTRTAEVYGAQWGLVPGPGLRDAYREFLTKPGEVRVQGTPSADLGLHMLKQFRPAEIVAKLNLRLSVNGKAVTDLSVTSTQTALPPPWPMGAAPPRRSAPTGPAPTGPTSPSLPFPTTASPAPRTSPSAEFRSVPTADLGGHVDKTVRVHLTDRSMREGRLLQVSEGMARVERRVRGGLVTHGIPLWEIDRVEVLF